MTTLAHQVNPLLPILQRSKAKCVHFMFINFEPERLSDAVGKHRCTFGMPAVMASLPTFLIAFMLWLGSRIASMRELMATTLRRPQGKIRLNPRLPFILPKYTLNLNHILNCELPSRLITK